MAIDFNAKPINDDKGLGKIRLGDEAAKEEAVVVATNNRKKLVIGGSIAAGVLVLAGVFALVSGGDDNKARPAPAPVPQSQPQSTPTKTSSRDLYAQSIAAKNSAIYRNDAAAHRGQSNDISEAYIGSGGTPVYAGSDFDVHVGLFKKGGVSVLIAAGKHAGTRIGFFPVAPSGGSIITLEKIGSESVEGRTTSFTLLPHAQRSEQFLSMRTPKITGSGVTIESNARQFEHKIMADGNPTTAFTVIGDAAETGVFGVTIWNGDSYKIDLNTMEYSVNSAFLTDPDYAKRAQETGARVKRTGVQGVIPAPAAKPSTAPAFKG